MRCLLPLIVFTLFSPLVLPVQSVRAQEPTKQAALDLDKTFNEANALLEKKRYTEALALYRTVLAAEPDLENVLRNGGMAAFFAGEYKTSLEYYLKLKAKDTNDGFIRTRLIQVYQALGDTKARDTERTELIALHKAGKDTSTLAKRTEFCRDQYSLGKRRILVYEPFVFAPRADNLFAVRYQFFVTGDDGKVEVRIEAGWDRAKKNAKGDYEPDPSFGAFYFDGYYAAQPSVPVLKGMFPKEPSYEAAKAHVQAILENKAKSGGGTPRPTAPSK